MVVHQLTSSITYSLTSNSLSTMSNQAAWIPAKCAPFKVDAAPMPEPDANEVVIRTHAVAINPVDAYIQKLGIIAEEFPTVVGCDVAGEITAVGSDVKRFQPGDRVLAALDFEAKRSNKGSFQLYCAAFEALAAKLPDNVGFSQACVLPLALSTAATGLFRKGSLALSYPQVDPKPNGKAFLVWGGSSSVGSCAIQLAKAAGYEVATTCSSRNFDYCKRVGADHVFDHTTDSVVEDVVNALKGKEFAGVFDAVMPPETIIKSVEIAHQLGGNKHVATVLVGPPHMMVPEGMHEDVEISYGKSPA